VFANQRQHRAIEKFLQQFRLRSTTQVLIEARVLQVDLTDEFSMGVDWEAMNLTGLLSFNLGFPQPALAPAGAGGFTATFRPGNDLNMAVSALNRFGTVRALSSPRVTVMNSQPAMFKVTQNIVYFEFDTEVETDTDTGTRTITVDSEIKRVPDGIMLNVVPTANPETGEILLVVRPTISRVSAFINDPTVAFTLAANGLDPTAAPANQIPQMTVQEIDSMLRLQSGQVVVMGGLMRDTNSVERQQVPVLGSLPFVGGAFRSHKDKVEKSELIILIRAQIVPGSNVDPMDRKIYQQVGQDRRPLRL
jgi:MSHA biogenesis protein MshL